MAVGVGAVYDDDVYDWQEISTTGLSTDAGALAFRCVGVAKRLLNWSAKIPVVLFIISLSRPRRTVSKG